MFQIVIRAHAVLHADDPGAVEHIRLTPRAPGVTDAVAAAADAHAGFLQRLIDGTVAEGAPVVRMATSRMASCSISCPTRR